MSHPQPWVRLEDGSVLIPGTIKTNKLGIGFVIALILLSITCGILDPVVLLINLPLALACLVIMPRPWGINHPPIWLRPQGLEPENGTLIPWSDISRFHVHTFGDKGGVVSVIGRDRTTLLQIDSSETLATLLSETGIPMEGSTLGPDPIAYTVIARFLNIAAPAALFAAIVPAARLLGGDPSPDTLSLMSALAVGSIIAWNLALILYIGKIWGFYDRLRNPATVAASPPRLSLDNFLRRRGAFDRDRERAFQFDQSFSDWLTRGGRSVPIGLTALVVLWIPGGLIGSVVSGKVPLTLDRVMLGALIVAFMIAACGFTLRGVERRRQQRELARQDRLILLNDRLEYRPVSGPSRFFDLASKVNKTAPAGMLQDEAGTPFELPLRLWRLMGTD